MGGLRILVVEDDPVIGMCLAETLTALGHEVWPVETTEDGAVLAAQRGSPELMIVDVRLRSGSGISLVDRVLSTGFVPHVFMTGENLRGAEISSRAVLLQKPFFDAELERALALAIGDDQSPQPRKV
jgi:two-component system, response regulator PdtaR